MVTTSRKTHARSAPALEPEESATTAETVPPSRGEQELTTLREVYDSLVGRTRLRAEIINGRLIVSPLGTPEHQDMACTLYFVLRPHAMDNGWKAYAGLDICADGSRDPYAPDFAMCPPDAPRWGDREIYASGLVMVGEVVSKGSADTDRDEKPRVYARAGIPVFLLIDPIAEPATVTVYSEPADDVYAASSTVSIGKEIHLPDPVDFTLDTSVFL
ncbi:Uma2 family endonuclease [Nonomuraea sp. NPDC046570]|uniref:Uma2 family endonuclease n=1 Tax=Nonomuraea sp. NPDC046570 TaxID=3155255 RepID=UPI0033FCCEA4